MELGRRKRKMSFLYKKIDFFQLFNIEN